MGKDNFLQECLTGMMSKNYMVCYEVQLSYFQKRFYDKETNCAGFCVIHKMYIRPHFPSIQLK
jgi:hypothetical protein